VLFLINDSQQSVGSNDKAEQVEGEPKDEELLEKLRKELDSERKKNEDLLMKLKYLQADYQNLIKRTSKETEEIKRVANERMVREIIELKETIEAALSMVRNAADSAVLQGFELILSKVNDILKAESVMEIKAKGSHFDPYYHEVVSVVESDEPDGTVVDEVRRGYVLNGRVIRPSMVKVSKCKKEVARNG
jgi:molecular chaperone GrpE